MNGRSRVDQEGKWTFEGGWGRPVIELCAVAFRIVDLVGDFYVGDEIYSDH